MKTLRNSALALMLVLLSFGTAQAAEPAGTTSSSYGLYAIITGAVVALLLIVMAYWPRKSSAPMSDMPEKEIDEQSMDQSGEEPEVKRKEDMPMKKEEEMPAETDQMNSKEENVPAKKDMPSDEEKDQQTHADA